MTWWPWPWPWSWQATALAAAAWLCLHLAVARLMEALWWRPRRLERHFARHGVRGPGYRFFFGSSIELIRLMLDASSRPAPPEAPHDVLPRVLAFYHHWRKLYGTVIILLPFFSVFINESSSLICLLRTEIDLSIKFWIIPN